MRFIYKLTMLLHLFPIMSLINNAKKKYTKKREINKSFSVNSNAKVSINNKYGKIEINTWNKNTVNIKVEISVNGDYLSNINGLMSIIDIKFNSNSSLVEANTIFNPNENTNSWKSRDINFKINYTVTMPVFNYLNLKNEYGDIILRKLQSKADIICSYGKITIGNLYAENNNINLNCCSNSSIKSIKSANINIYNSKLNIDNARAVDFKSNYSTLKINEVNTVNFDCNYSSICVNDVYVLKGVSSYLDMSFGVVKKSININTNYGSILVKNLAKNFKTIYINGQFTDTKIKLDSNAIFKFIISLKHSKFNNEKEVAEIVKSVSNSTKKRYEGKFGKGESTSKIEIKSHYGDISFLESKDKN